MQNIHSLRKQGNAWLQKVLVPRLNDLLIFADSKLNIIERFAARPEICRLVLNLPNLDSAFDEFILVHISDLHLDFWMSEKLLLETCDIISQEKPDCVVITGDFFTMCRGRHDPHTSFIDTLRQMASHQPTLAILGNHDFEFNADIIRDYLHTCDIHLLSNTVQTFERSDAQLHIAGLESIWTGEARMDHVLASLPETGAAILLAHEPDYAVTSAMTGRFDLQLSGHTHGGQIYLPLLGLMGKTHLGVSFPWGLYHIGDMLQYTNRGIGMAHLPIRINCPPEITVLSFKSV